MTQILGTVAYCRDRDLTFFLSDRKVTVVAELAPGFFAINSNATANHPPVNKVKSAGKYFWGIGGTIGNRKASLDEDGIEAALLKIEDNEEAYGYFLGCLSDFSRAADDATSYIFCVSGQTPRFRIGVLNKGAVEDERERDTVALHRNETDPNPDWECTKYWLDQDWLKGTWFADSVFEDGEYKPMIHVMSDFFVEAMHKETRQGKYYIGEDWDATLEIDGAILRSDMYVGKVSDYAGFLRRAREQILSTSDGFLRELWTRVAYGGLVKAGIDAQMWRFPKTHFETSSRSFKVFKKISMDREGFERRAMSEDELGEAIEYIKILESFFAEKGYAVKA